MCSTGRQPSPISFKVPTRLRTDQALLGLVHELGVQRRGHLPRAAGLERERGPAVDDAIDVVAGRGRVPGVEVVRGHGCFPDHYRARPQMIVQRVT